MASPERMDLEEPICTPTMTSKNVANAADSQQHVADFLDVERTRHGRAKRASRRLQAQLDGLAERDLQSNQLIQVLQNTNFALSQEILRLRCVADTLNGVIQMVCGHSNCTDGIVYTSADRDGGINQSV